MARSKQETAPIEVEFDSDVLRRIRQHTRTSMSAEVCGVLIGSERRDGVVVEAAIAGENAGQGSAHVTFTQETWEHIYKIKDEKYPDARIVGWYHSHPGFGVFLSDHDTFIHENFFSSPKQIAWVHDPHSDEEGCFGWLNGKIRRLPQISIVDSGDDDVSSRGEVPGVVVEPDSAEAHSDLTHGVEPRKKRRRWLRWVTLALTHIAVLALGLWAGSALLPRFIVVDQQGRPVDPRPLFEFIERLQQEQMRRQPPRGLPPANQPPAENRPSGAPR